MSTRRLVHSETCKAGELVKIAKEFENHWACKKFVGKLGKLRVKDDFAGKESAMIPIMAWYHKMCLRLVGGI